jgi:probable HAF family extracellular repeat protein
MLRLEPLEPRCVPSRYTLTDFGPGTIGVALNNQGVAAGSYDRYNPFLVEPDGSHHPITIQTSGPIELHHLTDSGILVGHVTTMQGIHAAYWDNDGQNYHDLGTLGGSWSSANGANGSGVIVGVSPASDRTAGAWVDRGAGLEDLGTLPGDSSADAFAINDAGVIIGLSGSHSVYWDPDGQIGVWNLPNGGTAIAINDSGAVTGNSGDGSTAWVYQDGQTHVLPSLGIGHAFPEDINALGDVSGTVAAPGDSYHAVLWHHGRIRDLNGPWTPAGWTLYEARGVNDRGQVVGYAYDAGRTTHGFLLTPVRDQPADWLGWALGLQQRHTPAGSAPALATP